MDYKLNKLTAQQIQELQQEEALRIISENTNTLADIETEWTRNLDADATGASVEFAHFVRPNLRLLRWD